MRDSTGLDRRAELRARLRAAIAPAEGGTRLIRNAGLLIILIALIVVIAATKPVFFSSSNIEVLASSLVTLGIASVGMTFLMIAANVDLSIGSMFALVAVLVGQLALHINPYVAFFVAVPMGALLGLANGVLVWRIRISPLVITLGTLSLYIGIAELATNGTYVQGLPQAFQYFGQGKWLGLDIPVWVLIISVLISAIVLSRTTLGRHVYAVGGNREAAELSGIAVRRIVIGLFVLNGALVGLAAGLEVSRFAAASIQFGLNLNLDTITAVILGGVAFTGGEGSIFGVMLAVVVLTLVNSAMVTYQINPFWDDVVKGGLLLIAVSLDQLTHDQRERYRTIVALRDLRARRQARGIDATVTDDKETVVP